MKRVLVITVNAWNDDGILNTMSNLFKGYKAENIYSLYFKSELPNTKVCGHSFQINEVLIAKKLFNPSIIVGREVKPKNVENIKEQKEEKLLKRKFDKANSKFLTLCRELVWTFSGWKETNLKEYLLRANPSVIFVTVASRIYTNRVVEYVTRILPNAKLVLFFVDDNYTYKAVAHTPFSLIHRFFLRRVIKRNVEKASDLFAISPKMKEEYSSIFHRNFTILTKSVAIPSSSYEKSNLSTKGIINILYVGNLLYGRMSTLVQFSSVLDKINRLSNTQFKLTVYTQTELSAKEKNLLQKYSSLSVYKSIPYSLAKQKQEEANILLYFESFLKSSYRAARLSFSTKITDYLSFGKPIIAMGPSCIAPIEYLKRNDIALVIDDPSQMYEKMYDLSNHLEKLNDYQQNVEKCCMENHSEKRNKKILDSFLM